MIKDIINFYKELVISAVEQDFFGKNYYSGIGLDLLNIAEELDSINNQLPRRIKGNAGKRELKPMSVPVNSDNNSPVDILKKENDKR